MRQQKRNSDEQQHGTEHASVERRHQNRTGTKTLHMI